MNRPAIVRSKIMNNRCGWREDGAFYFPSLDRPCEYDYPFEEFQRRGSLEEFKEEIYEIAHKNPLITFILAYSFLPPFLKKMKINNFGIYLYGGSLLDRQILTKLTASLWGAPIENWHHKKRLFEAVAHHYNDSLLCLNEIGGMPPARVRERIEFLAGEANNKRINFITSGEHSLPKMLKKNYTRWVLFRLIDINCSRISQDMKKLDQIIQNHQNFPVFNLVNKFEKAETIFEGLDVKKEIPLTLQEGLEKKGVNQQHRLWDIFLNIKKAGIVARVLEVLPKLPIEESVDTIFEHVIKTHFGIDPVNV